MIMTSQHNAHTMTRYQIKVKGHLDYAWANWFEDMTISSSGGETVLTGPVIDQAALHGLLVRIRNLNLTLLSVKRLSAELKKR